MAVAKSGAYELSEAGGVEGGYEGVVGGGDELMSGASGYSSGKAVVEERSANREAVEASA